MNIITLKCHNRPIYLLRTLQALAGCPQIKDYELLISCDLVDSLTKNQIEEAINYSKINDYMQTYVAFSPTRLGCSKNTELCLRHTFDQGADFAYHLEDDTMPSPALLDYWQDVTPLLDTNNWFAACTFHRPCHNHQYTNPCGLTVKRYFDASGGFAMSKRQWDRIQEMGGMFAVNWISDKGRTFDSRGETWLNEIRKHEFGGFGYPFDRYFAENKYSVFPNRGVVLNIGKVGEHLKNQNIHSQLQENFDVWQAPSSFDTKNISIDNRKFIEWGIEN